MMKQKRRNIYINQLFCCCAGILISAGCFAQPKGNKANAYPVLSKDSISKGKYTLIFINKEKAFDEGVKQKMIDAFFEVYPKESNLYNRHTARKVIFIIDPAYDGVAATSGHIVRYNPGWFKKHPTDIDVVTHEVMHIVQAYPNEAGPGWITEGIADYVRYKMGVDNEGANWRLPDYADEQNYNNSYRITARFFSWIEQHYDQHFVEKLDAAMRSKKYKDDFAKKETGKTFEELWNEYKASPAL